MNILGVEVEDIEEGASVLEVVVLVKYLDADGVGPCFGIRRSDGLGLVEYYGMIQAAARVAGDQISDAFIPSGGGED